MLMLCIHDFNITTILIFYEKLSKNQQRIQQTGFYNNKSKKNKINIIYIIKHIIVY